MTQDKSDPHAVKRPPVLGPEASPITFDRIARFPDPGWHVPRTISFSPDGKIITFLESEAQTDEMALFAYDRETKHQRVLVRASDLGQHSKPLSREEELRRERKRQRIQGITDYRWARNAPVIVIPFGGDLFLRDAGGTIHQLTDSPETKIDPKLSDDGSKLAFVRHGDLVLLDLKTGRETQLTHGEEGTTRGLSDFIGQEEFAEESGFWWSPASDRIAYLEVDERGVDVVPVLGYRSGRPDLMHQRYPRAGAHNPEVRVHILDLATNKTMALTLPGAGERYVGRFQWAEGGKALWFQALARNQRHLGVLRADAVTGEVHEVWSETAPTWVEFSKMKVFEGTPRVVTTRVIDGHNHLELRSTVSGQPITTLTSGNWDVQSIVALDETGGAVLFTGNPTTPLERRLFRVALSGGVLHPLTPDRGVHSIVASRDGSTFVDEHSAMDRLPRVVVRGADGTFEGEFAVRPEPDLATLGLRTPELLEIKGAGGVTLYGAMLRPRTLEPGQRYPVILMVYGGPGVQTVLDSWGPRLLWQHLADRGFVVFEVDNRGSAGRGPGFQAPIYKQLGRVELEDQVAGLDAIAALPFVDPSRVGVYGHSYGGFMAIAAMLKVPDRFRVGVAGAPVTDWRLYDTGYTERYMGTPEENPAGYENADLARSAGNLKGKLLVLHALMDENVHFTHTAHLTEALVAAGKPFDLVAFPGERHGYRAPAARQYAMRRVVDYFVENL